MRIGELIAWAVAAAVVGVPVYGAWCYWYPYMDCRRCDGNGKFRSPTGKAWRLCRKCKGSGSRVRGGRQIWTKLGVAKKKMVG